jgi:fibronectin type 3 domain-containing protein
MYPRQMAKACVIRFLRVTDAIVRIILLVSLCSVTLLGPGLVQIALAAQVSLAWDPNTEPDLAGYKVYYGSVSHAQTDSVDVGNATAYIVMGLQEGTTYFFAATAYDRYGRESGFSNEVSTTTSSLCTYTISPSSQSFAAAGGTGTTGVTTSAGCPWAVSNSASWVAITSGSSGTASGTVRYSVAANSGVARTAAMTIAGRILMINQAAAPAAFTITASAETGGTISPSGAVSVQAGASRTFTISPASRYRISSVTVDGASKGAVSSYTFSNVNAPHTISATFRRR